MMRKIKYIVLSCLFLTLLQCSEDQIDSIATGSISGIVVTVDSNERVQDVRISTVPATSTVFTIEDGTFAIQNAPEGSYTIQATKEGFVFAFEAANVLPNVNIEVVFDFEVENSLNNPPTTPLLLLPENNTIEVPVDVTLEWESTDPDEDQLIFTVSLFNENDDDVLLFENLTEPSLALTDLQVNTKYFWQVSVNDGLNITLLSEVFSFTTISSPTGAFLLVKEVNGNQVIFSADEDGNLFQLTSESVNSFKPRRNLAVNKIAFLRTISGQVHLFTMDFDGSNQSRVTSIIPLNGFDFNEIEFAWKPEGDKLLYPSFNTLYSINVNGSGLAVFYVSSNGNFISEIAWSTVNNIIAIKTNNNIGYNTEILILDVNGVPQETILTGMLGSAGGLDLNIDGTLVLYTRDISGIQTSTVQDSRLFIYNRSTLVATQLLTGVEIGFNEFDPKFTPAENEVVYQQKARNVNASSSIRSHNFVNASANSLLLFDGAKMPDWED